MKASNELLAQIAVFEGCKLEAYKCPAGVWTIGIGHTKGVKQGQKITKDQAQALLKGDLLPIENYLNKIKKDWTQPQFDAVCDFCFNLGTAAFSESTLRKRIMLKASDAEIAKAFKMWVKARVNGKFVVLPGLVKRRNWEATRWAEKS